MQGGPHYIGGAAYKFDWVQIGCTSLAALDKLAEREGMKGPIRYYYINEEDIAVQIKTNEELNLVEKDKLSTQSQRELTIYFDDGDPQDCESHDSSSESQGGINLKDSDINQKEANETQNVNEAQDVESDGSVDEDYNFLSDSSENEEDDNLFDANVELEADNESCEGGSIEADNDAIEEMANWVSMEFGEDESVENAGIAEETQSPHDDVLKDTTENEVNEGGEHQNVESDGSEDEDYKFTSDSSEGEHDDHDYGAPTDIPEAPPKEVDRCNGIFVSYVFQGREKEYPLVKNVSAQAWSFQGMVTVLNAGSEELKSWQVFVGFQHHELLVSAEGAVVVNGDGFPVRVGKNGTILAGYPQADLKTAIDTAADYTQMQVQVNLKGTMFGVGAKATPMPRALRLVNEGYKCPAADRK
ncbi:COBRA-like protein 10, partial [Striga hermonthica]